MNGLWEIPGLAEKGYGVQICTHFIHFGELFFSPQLWSLLVMIPGKESILFPFSPFSCFPGEIQRNLVTAGRCQRIWDVSIIQELRRSAPAGALLEFSEPEF